MIPKIFHWIWIGEKEIPETHINNIKGWMELHPDWKGIIWVDNFNVAKNLSSLVEIKYIPTIINKKYFDNIQQWVGEKGKVVAQSDILRIEIVCLYGGIYLDTDVICFKNIDTLLDNVSLCVSEAYHDGIYGNFASFFFGAKKNHPSLWNLVRNLGLVLEKEKLRMDDEKSKNSGDFHFVNQVVIPGPHYLCSELIKHSDCVIFPFRIGNPLAQWYDECQVIYWPAESFFNHNFEGSWLSKDNVKSTPPEEFLR